MEELSKPSPQLVAGLRAYQSLGFVAAVSLPVEGEPVVLGQRQRRLNATEVAALVAEREAGVPVQDLAAKYGINRWTVWRHMKQHVARVVIETSEDV